MIFAVFDVLLAVNMCINYSFFTFITGYKRIWNELLVKPLKLSVLTAAASEISSLASISQRSQRFSTLKPGFHSNATHTTQSLALRALRKRKPQETQGLALHAMRALRKRKTQETQARDWLLR